MAQYHHGRDAGTSVGGDIHPILPLLERVGVAVRSVEAGFVVCPGIELHTKENAEKDCIAYNNNGIPVLHCFHNSCAGVLAEVNARLFAKAHGRPACRGVTQKRQNRGVGGYSDPTADAELLSAVLEEYRWPYRNIITDPEAAVVEPIDEQWPHLIALFPDDAIVWIGRDTRDTGKEYHKCRFRTAKEWLLRGPDDGAYICPNSFKAGICSRSNGNIAARHFLVVESDKLNRDEVGAVFRFLESEHFGMRLRAVVDTAGKSLHGWFDYPPQTVFNKLLRLLPRLGCDRSMFKPSQPTRLPSAFRIDTGRFQRLIYFH